MLRTNRYKFCLLATMLYLAGVQGLNANHNIVSDNRFNFPGGIALVTFEKHSNRIPLVRFGTVDVAILESNKHWMALIGLDLSLIPGQYVVYIKHDSIAVPAMSKSFNVLQKSVTGLPDSAATAPPVLTHEVLSDLDFSNTSAPQLPLKLPVVGEWNSEFSTHTIANDAITKKNYISLNTSDSTIVSAPQHAIVTRIIDSKDLPGGENLAGKTVYLDHGRGLYSIISGLSDLSVDVGNGVMSGAMLGRINQSSSSDQLELTRSHLLIWQSVLNGAYVDPLILTQLGFEQN